MTVGGFFRGLKRRIGAILHSFRFTMIGSVFLIMLASAVIAGGITSAASPRRSTTPIRTALRAIRRSFWF